MPADEMTKEELDVLPLRLKEILELHKGCIAEDRIEIGYEDIEHIGRRFVEMAEKLKTAENQTLDAVLQKMADQRVKAAMDRFEKSKEA